MRNGLDPPVANIFLDKLESDVLTTSPRAHFIRAWMRYVDDVVCIWCGSINEAPLFLQELNSYDPGIKFTIEIGGNTLSFVDLKLSLADHGNILKIAFGIHRKDTFSGVSIHRDSLHHPTHKAAAINAAIHRLTNLPLTPEATEEEIRYIEKIAEINGLRLDIRQLIRRKQLRQILASPNTNQVGTKVKWIRLPFLGRLSLRLASELRRFNYRVRFYPISTLGTLSKLKDPSTQEEQSGIYRIDCGECDAFYIGQTGRSLATRFKEHKTKATAVSSHCHSAGHDLNKISTTLIHSLSKGGTMNALEEAETVKSHCDEQLNDLRATFIHHFTRFFYNFHT